MINCKFCGGSPRNAVAFTAGNGILAVERNNIYLDGPGAQERLAQVCAGHVYCAGLTPAVKHPATGAWVAGIVQRVGGRDENDHPFYAWLHVPLGMSPAQAMKIQFPGSLVGEDAELSAFPITTEDLFPYGTENLLGTGV